jgi:hypothetical protein
MSDFVGNIGRITEWVVVSNLENRAVNAACDKAQGWWHNRKHHHDSKSPPVNPAPVPPPPSSQTYTKYPTPSPQYPPQQASYMASPPPPVPSMGGGELLITVNHVEGLNQWGPLVVILECNYQRYQVALNQFQKQFTFPVNQFDHDQLFVWIQAEHQQQTIAHGEIPIRILLNNNNNWAPQQQRWIPLRDNYNGPSGQLLVSAEYRSNYSPVQQMPGLPPPYSYYS